MFCFSWDEEADDFLDDGNDGEAEHGEETENEKPLEAGELVRVHWVCSQFLVWCFSVVGFCAPVSDIQSIRCPIWIVRLINRRDAQPVRSWE
jgi:hypothetical protein